MLQGYRCFRCGRLGHLAAECDTLIPAQNRAEHEARIRLYVEWRIDGQIGDEQKRQLVAREFEMERERKAAVMAARRERESA